MQRDRKKVHKKVVKSMRLNNKYLATDAYLGLNRFRIDMFAENWDRFEDGSGGYMTIVFKMTDKATGNTALFSCNNYNYKWKIYEYLNDFLIRCSSGHSGHWPHLNYWAYDVHEIIPYDGNRYKEIKNVEDGVISTYDWTNWGLYDAIQV